MSGERGHLECSSTGQHHLCYTVPAVCPSSIPFTDLGSEVRMFSLLSCVAGYNLKISP